MPSAMTGRFHGGGWLAGCKAPCYGPDVRSTVQTIRPGKYTKGTVAFRPGEMLRFCAVLELVRTYAHFYLESGTFGRSEPLSFVR